MPRTPTPEVTAIISNASHTGKAWVFIADALGTLQLIGATAGGAPADVDPVESVEVTLQVDAHGTCTIVLARSQGFYNWSPFFIGAPNVLQPSDAKVAIGREVLIYAEAIGPDRAAPATHQGTPIFSGIIDSVSPPGETVTIVCSDKSAVLRDTHIERERLYGYCVGAGKGAEIWRYDIGALTVNTVIVPSKGKQNGHWYYVSAITTGIPSASEPTWPTGAGATVVSGGVTFKEGGAVSLAGDTVENVMGQILADNTDPARASITPTIYVPSTPSWVIKPYVQQRTSLLKALEQFPEQIGWRFYHWFDEFDVVGAGDTLWYMILEEPDRARVTVDKVIPTDHEIECSELEQDITEIRNVIHVVYGDASSRDPSGLPTRITVKVEDATSIATPGIGRRFMEICEDDASAIDSATEAATLANNCLADLKDPTCALGVTAPADPYVLVGDMVQIPADNLRFGVTQLLAARMVSHRFTANGASLGLALKGQPVSRVKNWLVRDTRQRGNEVHATALFDTETSSDTATAIIGGVRVTTAQTTTKNNRTPRTEIHISTSANFTPDSSTLAGVDNGDGQPVELVNLVSGKTYYRKSIPFHYNDSKKVRGSPGAETSFVAGRARVGHYDSTSTQSHLPLNGNFEHASDDLSLAPVDHWTVVTRPAETTEDWGFAGSVYYGTDTNGKGRYLVLRASATQRGNIVSSPFEVRRAMRAFNLYASIRRQGASAASGKDLIIDICGYSDAALSNQVINYSITLSGSASGPYPTLNTWYDAMIDIASTTGALATNVNFITIGLRRGTTGDTAYSWEIGDVYFQEADFYSARIDNLRVGQVTGVTHVRATTASAGSYANGNTITFGTEVYDTLSEYDGTNTFTATVAGKYLVTAAILCDNLAYAVDNAVELGLSKNGTTVHFGDRFQAKAAANYFVSSHLAVVIDLAVGDTLKCTLNHSRAAGNITLFTNAQRNWFTIDRLV